jgi:hypothetical protein
MRNQRPYDHGEQEELGHRVLHVLAASLALASSSASITQSEAASITAHGGSMTLQDCLALWDAATHMSKQEWKATCKRTMVPDFSDDAR